MLHIAETTANAPAPEAPFSVTEAALHRIAYLLSDEPEGTRFVVSVLGGGCSGFQYHFDLAAREAQPGDFAVDAHGAKVLVDDISLGLLKNSVLDYVEDLASAGFEIRNPNATARCGCGNSFSVAL